MRKLTLTTSSRNCEILVGIGALSRMPRDQVAFIVDPAAAGVVPIPADAPVFIAEGGEKCKTLESASRIFHFLQEREVHRDSILVGVGGGSVCDLTGFVGSTYLRGVPFGYVPTTLMAQVDAAIGGKNALNLGEAKNQIGTIAQPSIVICDPTTLRSLPDHHYRDGFSEVIKHALIGNAALFELMETSLAALLSRDLAILSGVIERSIELKVEIVQRDEHDRGERTKLNFGHTVGHALELTHSLSHGTAVALGMIAELRYSERTAGCPSSVRSRLVRLLEQLGLTPPLSRPSREIQRSMWHDKKRQGAVLRTPCLSNIGVSAVKEVEFDEFVRVVFE